MAVADATTFQLLRLHGNQEYRTLAFAPSGAKNVVVHPAGRLMAVGNKGAVLLIDLVTGREIGRLPSDRPLIWDSAGSLLTCGTLGLLRWPVQIDSERPERYRMGPPQRLLAGGPREQWGASDDGRTIAIPKFGQGAILVQLGSPAKDKRLSPQQDVRHCAVSPNGEWVATGSHDSTDEFGVKIWQAASGQEVMKLRVPAQCTPTFSPDGRWLLTNAGGCRLWQVGAWTEGPMIGGPWGCFSPNGRLLAVEDSPGAIRLVETDTGAEVVRLESPEQSRLPPECFTPDGARLIAWGHGTGSLHVWNLRALRDGLAALDLDLDAPPNWAGAASIPDPGQSKDRKTIARPLEVTLDFGDLKEPEFIQARSDLLKALIDSCQWDKAADQHSKVLALKPKDPYLWLENAYLRLRIGDTEGYRKLCGAMLERFEHSKNVDDIALLAHTCVLAPGGLGDATRVLGLAERRLAMSPPESIHHIFSLHILGLAHYRAGQNGQAVACLEKALRDHADWKYNVVNWLALAMAHHRLSHQAEAKQWLDKARVRIEEMRRAAERNAASVPWDWAWRDWMGVQILCDEAQTLVEEKPS
jgi:Flp pilus assembly protein TadD